jgi:predicted phosphoribosyltransferase
MLETLTRRLADRHAAGRELAERLRPLAAENPVVLGLARGGMPVAHEVAQALEARVKRYRGERPPVEVEGRTVIVVDDGLATGGTARAALRAVRARAPRKLVLAVPVGSPDTVEALQAEADEVVCLVSRSSCGRSACGMSTSSRPPTARSSGCWPATSRTRPRARRRAPAGSRSRWEGG